MLRRRIGRRSRAGRANESSRIGGWPLFVVCLTLGLGLILTFLWMIVPFRSYELIDLWTCDGFGAMGAYEAQVLVWLLIVDLVALDLAIARWHGESLSASEWTFYGSCIACASVWGVVLYEASRHFPLEPHRFAVELETGNVHESGTWRYAGRILDDGPVWSRRKRFVLLSTGEVVQAEVGGAHHRAVVVAQAVFARYSGRAVWTAEPHHGEGHDDQIAAQLFDELWHRRYTALVGVESTVLATYVVRDTAPACSFRRAIVDARPQHADGLPRPTDIPRIEVAPVSVHIYQALQARGSLSGIDLSDADFSDPRERIANSQRAHGYSSLRERRSSQHARLEHQDLSFAKLVRTNLHGQSLARSDLRGADLRDANLARVDLTDADLFHADLRGARGLDCERLTRARRWEFAYRAPALACGSIRPLPPTEPRPRRSGGS